MNQQMVYVAASYSIGLISFLSLTFWVRRKRIRSIQFVNQSILLQNHESDSKK